MDVFKSYPDFLFKGVSSDYNTAMNTILKETLDIIFVCVDNTLSNPFQFINEVFQFSEKTPRIVAISYSKSKAYDAIKGGLYDFILKPLTELEIRKTILKAKKERQTQIKNTICLKSYRDYQYLNADEILFLKADNNATDFYMKGEKTISAYKTLKTFEDVLPNNFLRIHKSYIINANHVSRINYGKYICNINEHSLNIPFTKTYIENIEEINKKLSSSISFPLN